ncbi:unnamed protein product [Didymodactylos carnosus]|uniref:K Homology domain-containing protein n=1 Tax=Didymodactylos carnosus TaxID=1234261 RepID=A0A814FUN7_9BILA|nr:unnamed protein product [Didymodactylos carnosus]CAF3757446.1 unnamed protein product [Didymodactylos carnosus]
MTNRTFKAEIEITGYVGAVIGRRGLTVQCIQSESDAKIEIVTQPDSVCQIAQIQAETEHSLNIAISKINKILYEQQRQPPELNSLQKYKSHPNEPCDWKSTGSRQEVDRVHNKGCGKYRAYKCAKCGKFQRRYLNKNEKKKYYDD